MRYVRAAALIGGVCLLALAVVDVASRRADAADTRRRTVEMAARLAAARVDGRVARTTATLASAPESVSLVRLARSLDTEVCSVDDAAACGVDVTSMDLAAESATASGSAAVAVNDDQVLVVVDRGDAMIGAIVSAAQAAGESAEAVALHPLRAPPADATPAATAELETSFASGRWAVTVDRTAVATGSEAFGLGSRIAIGVQAAIGCLAVVGALVAIGRDHRGLRRQATTDSLTGLPNRAEFERRAAAMLARGDRDDTGACLMLVDLDRFKAVNDRAGHAAGDRVLIEAAGRLRRAVRESDIVGRWGGDEFVILLAGVGDPLAVPDRVAAIETGLRGIPTTDGEELSASVGAAVAPLDGRRLHDLLSVADRAMYRSKAAGSGVVARRLS